MEGKYKSPSSANNTNDSNLPSVIYDNSQCCTSNSQRSTVATENGTFNKSLNIMQRKGGCNTKSATVTFSRSKTDINNTKSTDKRGCTCTRPQSKNTKVSLNVSSKSEENIAKKGCTCSAKESNSKSKSSKILLNGSNNKPDGKNGCSCSQKESGCRCLKPDSRVSKIPLNVSYAKTNGKKGCCCSSTNNESKGSALRMAYVSYINPIQESVQKSPCTCATTKTVIPASVAVPLNINFPRLVGEPQKSECHCKKRQSSNTLKNISSSNQIILPEVTVEIGPEKIQTIQIDVKPTDLTNTSSGIITIPVQLRFRKKCPVEEICKNTLDKSEEPREKLLFEACNTKKYFYENYMEPLLEEPPNPRDTPVDFYYVDPDCELGKPSSESEVNSSLEFEVIARPADESFQVASKPKSEEIEVLEKPPQPSDLGEPQPSDLNEPQPSNLDEPQPSDLDEPKPSDLVEPQPSNLDEPQPSNLDESGSKNKKSETKIIGMSETPWYEAIKRENYIEPYLIKGYCASTGNVQVQTDLVLGDKLLSDSLNSISDNKSTKTVSETQTSSRCKCGTTKASDYIQWDKLFLPAKGMIEIKPASISQDADKIVPKLFSEPPDSKISPPESELPPLIPIPEKISFVYNLPCEHNEPYLNVLRRFDARNDSPCTSKSKIPWKKILLSENIAIRKVKKLKIVKKPICSVSAPCVCATRKESNDNSYSNIPTSSVDYAKSSNKIVNEPESCPLLPKTNPSANSSILGTSTKSSGNNTFVTKIYLDKTNRYKSPDLNQDLLFQSRVTLLRPGGKMATKVTFKRDKNANASTAGPDLWKTDSNEISPIDSKTVTCKYLNTTLVDSTEKIPCNQDTCKKRKPQPVKNVESDSCPPCVSEPSLQLKPDPVVAAFQACEAELKPVREALHQVKQKLKNLHMPELDCLFNKEKDFNDIPSISKRCSCCQNRKPQQNVAEQPSKYSSPGNKQFQSNSTCPHLQQQHNNVCCSTQNSSSNISASRNYYSVRTVMKTPSKRNKGIQKTGSMYKTNRQQHKCASFGSNDTISISGSETGSSYTRSSEEYIKPCGAATHPKIPNCPQCKSKRVKNSGHSLGNVAESQCPFIEAMKSLLLVENSKVLKDGKNVSYDAKVKTKQMRNMRLHMRIRPSESKKK